MSSPAPTRRDGSRLCLRCGLCCQGVLHDRVVLGPGEERVARRRRLEVVADENGRGLRLPCSAHRHGRCTLYAERPTSCRTYRCSLLERYAGGQIDLESALSSVAQVRGLISSIRQRLAPGASPGSPRSPGSDASVWQQLRRSAEVGPLPQPAALLLDAASLDALIRRHFSHRPAVGGNVAS